MGSNTDVYRERRAKEAEGWAKAAADVVARQKFEAIARLWRGLTELSATDDVQIEE